MRVLVLAQDIGVTAPGIVFERILYELSKKEDVELDLVVSNYCSSTPLEVEEVQVVRYPDIHPRINKLIIGLAGTDAISHLLSKRIELNNNYDIIFSLASFHHYFGLISGLYLKKRLNVKWGCYFVDAVPAPNGWVPNDLYFKSVKRMISNTLRSVDYLASVSKEMLEYQLSLFKRKEELLTDVLYPPSTSSQIIHYERNSGGNPCFLYTGNIYGLRKAKYVIEAFSTFCKDVNNIDLVFVGNCHYAVEAEKKKYNDEVAKRIKVEPHTSNLVPYYKRSIALIDIDADVENDVFLSSKIASYLTVNRPIICETGLNSPSRHIFSDIPSVIQCNHSPIDIKRAMNYVLENQNKFDYTDRNHILKEFSAESVAQKLYIRLKSYQK